MERPVFKPIGTPVEQLDTPALVVDLSILQKNLETVHSFFKEQDAKLRPHIEAHRCPTIAHKQLAAGGTVGGISVTTVGEAETFAQNGFTDIFIANEVVTPQKISRVCALAHQAKITVAMDNAQNVKSLSEAAQNAGVTLNVVVDIHTRLERCGVEPGQPALALAKEVGKASGLNFAGLMSYEGAIIGDDVVAESKKWIQQVLDTRELIEKEGIDVEVVSVGGTHNYEIAGAMSGVTEVPAGAYALMDARYAKHRPQLENAAKVLSTVISRPEPALAILDVGQKAMSVDTGLPVSADTPGTRYRSASAEHGFLDLSDGAQNTVDIAGKVWLTPFDIGNCANVYDYIHAARNGKLEALWDVSARGRYR